MSRAERTRSLATIVGMIGLMACGGDDEMSSTSAQPLEALLQGSPNIEAWLATGSYKAWHCEPAVHAARAPSPHGYNRICANDEIADNVAKTGSWPRGAAAVKELYDAADARTPIGYAVYLKTASDSAGGANWYWYERVPLDHAAPHDSAGVVANGLGDDGPERAICVGCHVAAGTDPAHTPSVGGRDQVYTPVE